jgi:hypothetical protein
MDHWPRDFWQLGKFLLHQQCWCWGRDVRCPQGNLLMAYGFDRQRPERPEMGSSRYVLARPEEPELYLWAFGMLVRQPGEGGIYVGRYCFVPGWVPDGMPLHRAWRGESFALQRPPDTRHQIRVSRQLLRWTLRFLAGYEEWVLREQGVAWRRESLREWHEPSILPERLGEEWRRMSWHIPEPPVVWTGGSLAPAARRSVLTGEARGG